MKKDSLTTVKYIENQFEKVNLTHPEHYPPRIKITTLDNATNWLTITNDQLLKIKQVLLS